MCVPLCVWIFSGVYNTFLNSYKDIFNWYVRGDNTRQRIAKDDKSVLLSPQNSGIPLLVYKSMRDTGKGCLQFTKRHYIGNNGWMSSFGVTFNPNMWLTCN